MAVNSIHGGLALPAFTHVAMYGIGWSDTVISQYDVVAIHGVTTVSSVRYLKLGPGVDTPATFTTDDRFRVAGIVPAATTSGKTFVYVKSGKATIDMGAGKVGVRGAGIILDTVTGQCDSLTNSSTPGDNMKIFAFALETIAAGTTGTGFVLSWRG